MRQLIQRGAGRTVLTVAAVAGLLGAAACGGGDAGGQEAATGGDFPVTVENCGREVTVDRRPEHVYVIGGEAGTLVHAAGGANQVGTYSPLVGEPLGETEKAFVNAESTPIGSSKDISREVIIGAAPDLVVTYGLNEFAPEDLESAGIAVMIVSGYCGGFGPGLSEVEDPIGTIYKDIENLGRLLGTREEASRSVTALRDRVDAVREKAKQSPPPSGSTAAVFVPSPDGALGAYGNNSMIHQQITYLGLSNVFADTDERLFDVNNEALIEAAPERLIALHEPGDIDEQAVRQSLASRQEIAGLPAIVNGDVMVLNFFYSAHGTLAVEGLERLAEELSG